MTRPWEQGKTDARRDQGEPNPRSSEEGHYDCDLCGFIGAPVGRACDCDDGPCDDDLRLAQCREGSAGCPVCLDGTVDPWSLIREIRALIRAGDPSTRLERGRLDRSLLDHVLTDADRAYRARLNGQAADVFQSEWELLQVSILTIWTDLTQGELASIQGDRLRFEGLLKRRYGYGTALAHQLTDGLQDLHERFNGKWDVVRDCVPRHWPEVTRADVQHMSGTIGELAGLVERRYALARGQGRIEVIDFLHQIDYPLLIRLFRAGEALASPASEVGEEPDSVPDAREQSSGI